MCRYQSAWLTFLQGETDSTKNQLSKIINETIFKELAHIFQAEIQDFIDNNISGAIDSYLEFLDLYHQFQMKKRIFILKLDLMIAE